MSITVRMKQPPAWQQRHPVVYALLIALDISVNAAFWGKAYETISCRIGDSMEDGGWASRVWWPAWWRAHCLGAEFTVTFTHQ